MADGMQSKGMVGDLFEKNSEGCLVPGKKPIALPISSIQSRGKHKLPNICKGNTAFNTNVRGLLQPTDVTTRNLTMDTYLLAQWGVLWYVPRKLWIVHG